MSVMSHYVFWRAQLTRVIFFVGEEMFCVKDEDGYQERSIARSFLCCYDSFLSFTNNYVCMKTFLIHF